VNARFLKLMFGALIRAAERWRSVKQRFRTPEAGGGPERA
jgi:hypothetical protein